MRRFRAKRREIFPPALCRNRTFLLSRLGSIIAYIQFFVIFSVSNEMLDVPVWVIARADGQQWHPQGE